MLSKNNYQEKIRKMENKKERFSIRKFSVGAASVLIGFTIFGLGAGSKSVKADTLNPNQVNVTNTAKASKEASGLVKNQTNNQNITLDTNKTAETTNVQKKEVVSDNKVQTNKNESVKQTTNTNAVAKTAATKQVKATVQTNSITQAQNTSNNQEQSVSDYSQFINALQDANVNTIKLNQNIDFSNTNLSNNTYQTINNYGSARQVTIDGQNQYSLDMGNRYISLGDNTHYDQGASTASHSWNVVLKDLSLQTVSGYGPFWFKNSAANNDAITFNGVTTSQDSGQLLNNKGTNVNFEGKNNLQGNLTSSNTTGNALIQANNVNFLNGSTTLAANNSTSNNLSNINASGNVVVSNGTTVNFNSANTSNMAGITIPNGAGAGNQTIDNATSGVVRLMPNAKVTMELGSGSSMGIMNASDLDLQENSSLKVTTSKMNTTGWRSAALIGLDYDGKTADSTVRVGQNALLSIIRTKVTDSDSPLLAMGPKDGLGATYHLDVNGGSLDLEDSSYSSYLPDTYTLTKGSYRNGWPAILTMWGSSSQNYINFTNAKLVNLQRTAANKPGYLIKTDGAGDVANQQTHIVINSADSNYNTPLTMVPAGASDPVTWNIKYLNNTSQGGDFAYAFRSHKQYGAWNQPGSEYMIDSVNADTPAKGVNEVILAANPSETGSNSFSDGSVVPEGTETAASNALNSFINHFSWWNASGVKFGSELQTNNQYTPSYKPVSVEQGKTATTDPTFINKNGEVITTPDGTHFAGTEATPTWSKIDPSTGRVTLTPTTSTTPGAYNIPVTITYADGSKQNANVPVVVTKGTQTVIWNNDNATVVTISRANANAHETSDNSQVISASGMITSVQSYSIDQNHQIATTPTTITNYTADWENTPNTVVETATAAGKNIANNVIDITIDGKTDKTNPFDIDAKGAGAKTLAEPIDILAGSDLTSSQFKALVQNNIPDSEIQSTAWQTKPVQDQGGVIRITFNDKDAQGQNTYLDINIPASSINVTTEEKDSKKYHITYPHLNVERPDSGQNTGSVNPTIPADMPNDEVSNYRIGTFTAPTGVTVDVDQTTGKVTETVDSNAQLGSFNVPVVVTFKDGSSKIVNVPASVTGMDHEHNTYYGDQTMTSFTAPVASVHKTSVDFTPSVNDSAISTIKFYSDWNGTGNSASDYKKITTYKLSTDGKNYVNEKDANDKFAASAFTYSWITNLPGVSAPNTNVSNFANGSADTLYQLANGQVNPAEQTTTGESLPGNSKWRYNFKINDADVVSKLGLGVNAYNNWLNNYFNFYGATTGSTLNFKQNSNISDLTQEQYRTLINVNSLGREGWNGQNTNSNAPEVLAYIPGTDNSKLFSMSWAPNEMPSTKEVANNVPGTVRIMFNDGTYLDVKANINVEKDGNSGKPDDQKTSFNQQVSYQYDGKEVAAYTIGNIAKGSSLSAEQLKNIINSNLPANYSIVDGYSYPAAESNITSQPAVLVVPVTQSKQQHDDSDYNATVIVKYIDAETNTSMQTKNGKDKLTFNFNKNQGLKASTLKADIDSEVPTNWKVDPSFVYPVDQTTDNTIIVPLVHATKDITPTTPGVDPTDPKYKDMFTSVSRKIYQTKPGKAEQLIATQTVNFGRNGVEDLVTGKVTGTGAWKVGKIENNKFVLGGEAEYPTAAVEQISSYDSYVNGTKATEIQSASAIENGTPVSGQAVHITYQQSETPVADVTVSYQFYDTVDKKNVGNPIVVSGKPGVNVKTNLTIPAGYKLAAGQTLPENVVIPAKNEAVVINLVHATKDITPTTPGVNPTDPKYKDMFTSVSRDIYQTKPGEEEQLISTQTVNFGRNGVEDLVTGKVTGTGAWEVGKIENNKFVLGGEAEYPTAAVEQISSYDSYVNGTKATEIQSASAIKDGTPVDGEAVHITYQKSSTATPYDPNNKDMNKDVVRTITVNKVDGTTETIVQTVHFVRGGEGENVEADTPWTVGVRDGNTWKSTGATEGTWPEYNVPQVTDYTSTVDGRDAKVVLADKNVNANTPNTNVVVAYTKTTTPTDADKYTPEGQDVHTTPGVVPPAEKGIKNKDDMPKGTKYTWEKTPDVTKPGKTTGTVIVTYPDGSKDKVDVPVIIDTPTTPTDADKYTPEGQDVHTTPGVVPPAEKGIKNKDDMPKGTKYTWEKTPDVTKPGKTTGTVIVTYPDGSKDKVDVPVIIDNPTTPTDADKYTPEGQDVHTTPGVVPPAEKGIKNKDDMPKGTKYTWEKTPDVTKPGKTTGTVIVTYPDGSKDKVDVPVIIDTPTTPTDADKYTPEGQDVHTTPGVVPPAEKGIKNKDDMPKGTKYTWEKTPDVTKPGKTTGTVIVTYPDGSKDKVNVTVIIGTNHVTPEPQPIHTTPGVVPNPSEGIKNKDDMPEGTKYTWKEVPDVSTIGEHAGVVTVTYPDGSSVDVTVKVYVDATGTSDNNSGKTTETNSEANTAKAATVNENHHAEKNTLPQTGAKSENTAGILGLAIATVGSLFGLGVDRKKRQK
ncbi:Rib/alpha-like domain-containing protein [Lactobacillus gasseri]|uniref:Rib/alpha-like domain-containing protein n=1 Tax=Lactobacillus gasseri TaxID=1596 RepID=UPI0021BD0877|nr:Rib/alpha-like domain-containing protein [Lactobacillus gasseri]